MSSFSRTRPCILQAGSKAGCGADGGVGEGAGCEAVGAGCGACSRADEEAGCGAVGVQQGVGQLAGRW